MTDDRKTGVALIAGSLGGIFTMMIHPHGSGTVTADQVAHLAIVSGVAHSVALVSFVLVFLGACGLLLRLGPADRIAFAATVTYGFACVSVMIAAAVSGFIVPDIMRHMIRDVPEAAAQWRIVISGIFQINQAFARMYAVGASLSILLWSISALRRGGLSRGIAIYGCVVAPILIVGIAMGHLRLDVHGMGVIVLAHAIWFVTVGAQLCAGKVSTRA